MEVDFSNLTPPNPDDFLTQPDLLIAYTSRTKGVINDVPRIVERANDTLKSKAPNLATVKKLQQVQSELIAQIEVIEKIEPPKAMVDFHNNFVMALHFYVEGYKHYEEMLNNYFEGRNEETDKFQKLANESFKKGSYHFELASKIITKSKGDN